MTHLDRKELKRPDAFLLRAEEIVAFINENSRALMVGLAFLFVAGVGVAVFQEWKERKNHVAAARYFTAQKAFKTALTAIPKTETGWAAKVEKQVTELEKIPNENAGTEGAFEALLSLGDANYERGNAAKAVEYYNRALPAASNRKARQLVELSLGYAFESAGRYDEAISLFEKLTLSDDKSLRGDTIMALARNQALKGDKPKAIEQYDKAAKEFPNTPTARLAEAQKKHLGG